MKWGFLNTQKAKQRVAKAARLESAGPLQNKSKDKTLNDSDPYINHLDVGIPTMDPHELPKIIKAQRENKSRGVCGTTTGSRLAKWMRQIGELIAKDELYWADHEEDPKVIPVVDMEELIWCRDQRVAMGIYDKFSSRKEVRERAERATSAYSDQDSSQSAAAEAEAEDSIPQVNNQIDDAEKEHGEAVPVTNDGEGKSVTGARLDEPIQVDDTGDKSTKKGTDEPEVSASKHDSPFDPAHYPSPWPFIPCANGDRPPILQQRLPLHLLPQRIHVHDPWNRLSIYEGDTDGNTPWLTKVTEGGDIVRTYSLSLSTEGKQAALAARKKAELEEDKAETEENVMPIFPAEEEGPTDEPLIEVVLPPRPLKRTQVEEAHLYLSPPAICKGHHSYVYFAEWELPRDVFVEPKLCRICVEEDAHKQVQELKDQGKWEELLKGLTEKLEKAQESDMDVSSEPEHAHASPKRAVGQVTIKEHRLPHETISFVNGEDVRPGPSSDEKTADVVASEVDSLAGTASHATETGNTEADVDVEMDVVEERDAEPGHKGESEEPSAEGSAPQEKGKGKEIPEQDGEDEETEQSGDEQCEEEIFTVRPPRIIRVASYSGPAVRIDTNVKWRLPWGKACIHGGIGSENPVPRTATVSVAAKLSIEYDEHLQREAKNYQLFPSHFFEHWNGYNVIPPLHDPVPVGALCPQFYGYYTPDDIKFPDYLSPILLLEHCGAEIVLEELNDDDKRECASLLFRFQHAGWLHESFAARNVLWQEGKPTEWPIERMHSKHKSFRLIDFGRSKKNEQEAGLRLHMHRLSM